METPEEKRKAAKETYDQFIMKELLTCTHVSNPPCVADGRLISCVCTEVF